MQTLQIVKANPFVIDYIKQVAENFTRHGITKSCSWQGHITI